MLHSLEQDISQLANEIKIINDKIKFLISDLENEDINSNQLKRMMQERNEPQFNIREIQSELKSSKITPPNRTTFNYTNITLS